MTWKSWEEDAAAICAEIRGRRAPLKIVLKTKDEPLLLRGMVEHHLRIVGTDGLIVFDNGSTDENVVRYLDELSRTVRVYRFAVFHNAIHVSSYFAALYAALRASCRYYMLLDTDERLYWFKPNGTYRDDAAVVRRIVASGQRAVAGIWANNFPEEERVVEFTHQHDLLKRAIRNGKVILSSAVEPPAVVLHNFQVPTTQFEGNSAGSAVIVHLRNLSREQRLASNLAKLSSYSRCHGLLETAGLRGDVTLEQVLSIDADRLIPSARQYVKEIRSLAESRQKAPDLRPRFGVPGLRLEGGKLIFANPREKREMLGFLRNPTPVIAAALDDEVMNKAL